MNDVALLEDIGLWINDIDDFVLPPKHDERGKQPIALVDAQILSSNSIFNTPKKHPEELKIEARESTEIKNREFDGAASAIQMDDEDLKRSLINYFGYSDFRNHQREAITAILAGKDVVVLLATGSGKSLTYQFPVLHKKGIGIVVSPLIGLMHDQVMNLAENGISACFLGSAQSDPTVEPRAMNGEFNLIYVTPEKLIMWMPEVKKLNQTKGITLLAIDEAHCVSQWGHDFRKEYMMLSVLRENLPSVPIIAVTATATRRVVDEIISSLKLSNPLVLRDSFNRKNLSYVVKTRTTMEKDLLPLLTGIHKLEPCIIYCITKKHCEEVTAYLNLNGLNARCYHAGRDDRMDVHEKFLKDEISIVVCTVAFGLGVDKPDVRGVIHYGSPQSLESYYQQTGRAGRDGDPAHCVLYWKPKDFNIWRQMSSKEGGDETIREYRSTSVYNMEKYCNLPTCRRAYVLRCFDEEIDLESNCGNCDNCLDNQSTKMEVTNDAYLLLLTIDRTGGRFGLGTPIEILRGSSNKKILQHRFHQIQTYNRGVNHSVAWWKSLAFQLINLGFIAEKQIDKYRIFSLTDKGINLIESTEENRIPVIVKMTNGFPGGAGNFDMAANDKDSLNLTTDEKRLYDELKIWRKGEADSRNLPAYMICQNSTLEDMARKRPSSLDLITNVSGIGISKRDKYGPSILEVLDRFCAKYGLQRDTHNVITIKFISKPAHKESGSHSMTNNDKEMDAVMIKNASTNPEKTYIVSQSLDQHTNKNNIIPSSNREHEEVASENLDVETESIRHNHVSNSSQTIYQSAIETNVNQSDTFKRDGMCIDEPNIERTNTEITPKRKLPISFNCNGFTPNKKYASGVEILENRTMSNKEVLAKSLGYQLKKSKKASKTAALESPASDCGTESNTECALEGSSFVKRKSLKSPNIYVIPKTKSTTAITEQPHTPISLSQNQSTHPLATFQSPRLNSSNMPSTPPNAVQKGVTTTPSSPLRHRIVDYLKYNGPNNIQRICKEVGMSGKEAVVEQVLDVLARNWLVYRNGDHFALL